MNDEKKIWFNEAFAQRDLFIEMHKACDQTEKYRIQVQLKVNAGQ